MEPVKAKVTANGQISLPAELRRRWGVREVLVVDRGDYAEVRPHPEDVLATLKGTWAGQGLDTEIMRRIGREEDAEREARDARREAGNRR